MKTRAGEIVNIGFQLSGNSERERECATSPCRRKSEQETSSSPPYLEYKKEHMLIYRYREREPLHTSKTLSPPVRELKSKLFTYHESVR